MLKTPKIKDHNGKPISNSISEIVKVKIGGVNQYLMIRGNSLENPIILFIHGGPGQAEIGFIREIQRELEEKFIVVRWDQRGSGLSTRDIPIESLNVETLISDAKEITDYLLERFKQTKIFISGHSFGTIISTNLVKDEPEKYSAYIGVGQLVDAEEGEKISYDYTLSEAERQNNLEIISTLKKIGPPPYSIDDLLVRAQCLSKLGCVFKTKPKLNMGKALLLASEYSLSTKFRYMKNAISCSKIFAPYISQVKFLEDIKELKIPIYFIMGRHDYHTPTTMVEKFYNQLKAPKKQLIIFEASAHVPHLEETNNFNKTLIKILEENQ